MRDFGGKFLKFIMVISISLPFLGNGALKRDYFQPIFSFEYQSQDRYVINQKYFASKDILPSEFYKNNEIFKVVDQIRPQAIVSYEDMLKLVPTTLTPTSDQNLVTKALIDSAFRMFLSSQASQELTIVKTVNRVEKAMNTDIKLGKINGGVENKLSVNYDLASQTTKLALSGVVEGQASFSGVNHETIVTLSKKIENGLVGLSHVENITETKDLITLSYNFP
jgi:hypothetical protein